MDTRRTLTQEEMFDALKSGGGRITGQRKAIVEYLAGRTDHPSARQIYEAVHEYEPNLSLTTVYNTLGTLVGKGLIREIEFNEVENRFDTNLSPHANLVCSGCGLIIDFDQSLPVSTSEVLHKTGFEAKEFRVEYRGLCAVCRGRGEGNAL